MIARDQIVSIVDRILRLKEEAKGINADIREVYAEAKSNGFDKTQLGKLVNYIEKREADGTKVAEADAIYDLYLCAYDGKTGTRVATHTHEAAVIVPSSGTSKRPPEEPEVSQHLQAGGGSDEAGKNSTSGGITNLGGDQTVTSQPAGSGSEEIPGNDSVNTPEGRSGTAREAPSADSGDDVVQASSGTQSAAPFISPDAPSQNEAAETTAGANASGLSSPTHDARTPGLVDAEEAIPRAEKLQASSAISSVNTQRNATKGGKGDRIPVPGPRHFASPVSPELPKFLDRRTMNAKPETVSENR